MGDGQVVGRVALTSLTPREYPFDFCRWGYFDDCGLPAPCPGPSPHVSKISMIYCLKTRTFRCLLP